MAGDRGSGSQTGTKRAQDGLPEPWYFGLFRGIVSRQSACDAGHSLLDYVQISHFVTKVLIRKRLRRLTNK
jgi:hypothetical protein